MSRVNKVSTRRVSTLLASGSLLIAPLAVAEECRDIEDDAERLACYDSHSAKPPAVDAAPVEESPVEIEPAPETAREAEVVPLSDEIGQEDLDRDADEQAIIRGKVVECRKNNRDRVFFYFDNGQIWKQTDTIRHHFRDCDFDVEIEKSFFGYRMDILPDGPRVRISRVK